MTRWWLSWGTSKRWNGTNTRVTLIWKHKTRDKWMEDGQQKCMNLNDCLPSRCIFLSNRFSNRTRFPHTTEMHLTMAHSIRMWTVWAHTQVVNIVNKMQVKTNTSYFQTIKLFLAKTHKRSVTRFSKAFCCCYKFIVCVFLWDFCWMFVFSIKPKNNFLFVIWLLTSWSLSGFCACLWILFVLVFFFVYGSCSSTKSE